jgi:2-haloacid dehalogenase
MRLSGCLIRNVLLADDRFPDVEKTLRILNKDDRYELVMFSNGSHVSLENAMKTHPILRTVFNSKVKRLSCDDVRAYKPSRITYRHLLEVTGKLDKPEEAILISSNPFDVCGSRNMGMKSVWINRSNAGWHDRLGEGPTWILKAFSDLSKFPEYPCGG